MRNGLKVRYKDLKKIKLNLYSMIRKKKLVSRIYTKNNKVSFIHLKNFHCLYVTNYDCTQENTKLDYKSLKNKI